MKILDIKLSNFQGIASMEISLGGKSASIFGDNGTGKTTIFNAITWLLFDKPSTGAKNWTPKTRGADGEKHNLEHSVTATFVLQDGSRVTLGKTLREVYKKKRGTTTAEYTGNTVDYYLDGVPVKEKEYTAAVAEYCGGEQTMKLLTMPDYFPEAMEWKKRRELLLEICGDITDDDVIEGSPELHDLPSYLIKPGTLSQFYTVEEYSKIAKARKTDINRQLDAIPGRIDEAQRAIPAELPAKDVLEARLHAASQATEEARQMIADIRAGAGDTHRAALAAVRAELAEARANYTRKNQDAQAGVYEALAAIDKEIRETGRRAEDARAEAGTKRRQAERLTNLRESILAEYREAAALKFDAGQETCPTCGRRLPEDKIEAMRGDFNQRRAERLAAINERGRREANKDMIAGVEAQAEELDRRPGKSGRASPRGWPASRRSRRPRSTRPWRTGSPGWRARRRRPTRASPPRPNRRTPACRSAWPGSTTSAGRSSRRRTPSGSGPGWRSWRPRRSSWRRSTKRSSAAFTCARFSRKRKSAPSQTASIANSAACPSSCSSTRSTAA